MQGLQEGEGGITQIPTQPSTRGQGTGHRRGELRGHNGGILTVFLAARCAHYTHC